MHSCRYFLTNEVRSACERPRPVRKLPDVPQGAGSRADLVAVTPLPNHPSAPRRKASA